MTTAEPFDLACNYNEQLHKIVMSSCAETMSMEDCRNMEIKILSLFRDFHAAALSKAGEGRKYGMAEYTLDEIDSICTRGRDWPASVPKALADHIRLLLAAKLADDETIERLTFDVEAAEASIKYYKEENERILSLDNAPQLISVLARAAWDRGQTDEADGINLFDYDPKKTGDSFNHSRRDEVIKVEQDLAALYRLQDEERSRLKAEIERLTGENAEVRNDYADFRNRASEEIEKQDTELTRLRAELEALKSDAARFQWLMADHDNPGVRQRRRSICEHICVKSYSSVSRDIDLAMQEQAKQSLTAGGEVSNG